MSDVRKTASAVDKMATEWPLIKALLGGTMDMRKAGGRYLPKWPNEKDETYNQRLETAVLFPALNRTVEVLAAKPFAKPITFGQDVPARLLEWCEDIDLEGRNLHVFAGSLCENALGYGLAGILVECPKGEGAKTQADEAKAGIRPYFVHIMAENILGWRAAPSAGKWVLQQLRLLECVTEPDGEYGEKTVEQVRVLTPGAWQTFRKSKVDATNEVWLMHEEGKTSLKAIPFVPVYGKRMGFMMGMPPLLDLAYMNVEHWQSKSDQQNILHVARVPILTMVGGDEKTELAVGASVAVKLPIGGTLTFTEHTGKAIESGRQSILDIEDRMRQAGAELLVIKPGNTTEVQVISDNEQGMCALARIAHGLEDALDQALQYMADFVNEKSGGHVTIYKDFGAATLAEASAELLLKSNMGGKISDETYLKELQRRGIISPDLDVTTEPDRIREQGPSLGTAGDE